MEQNKPKGIRYLATQGMKNDNQLSSSSTVRNTGISHGHLHFPSPWNDSEYLAVLGVLHACQQPVRTVVWLLLLHRASFAVATARFTPYHLFPACCTFSVIVWSLLQPLSFPPLPQLFFLSFFKLLLNLINLLLLTLLQFYLNCFLETSAFGSLILSLSDS